MLTGGWHRGFWSKGYRRPAAVSDRPLAVATVGVKSTDTGSEECGRRGFASSIVASRLICHHAGIEGRMTMKDLHRKAHLLPHRRHPEHRSPRQPELRHRRHHLQGDCCPDIIQSVAALTANEKVIRIKPASNASPTARAWGGSATGSAGYGCVRCGGAVRRRSSTGRSLSASPTVSLRRLGIAPASATPLWSRERALWFP